MKIKEYYDNVEEFFELIKEIITLKLDNTQFSIKCNFILYFILLESRDLPYNYNLFIENIKQCHVSPESSNLVEVTFESTTDSIFQFYLSLANFDNYIENGIDFRILGNEPAILTINKESTLLRLNRLRVDNIKSLIKDLEVVEYHFSTNIEKILRT